MPRIPILVPAIVLSLAATACGSSSVGPPEGSFDCSENSVGSGDLAVDIVGRWFWIQNASAQYFDFAPDGTAVRTWTSDVSDEVRYTKYDYAVEGDTVQIDRYGEYRFVLADGLWTVDDRAADTEWIRCRRL